MRQFILRLRVNRTFIEWVYAMPIIINVRTTIDYVFAQIKIDYVVAQITNEA